MIDHLDDEQLNTLADRIRLGTPRDEDADPLRHHLEGCSQCRERFGRLAKLLNVAEALPRRVEPPSDLWPSIRATIEQGGARAEGVAIRAPREVTQQRWFARRRLRIPLAAAAAVLIAILFGTHAGDRLSRFSRSPEATAASSATAAPNDAGDVVSASAVTPLDTEDLHAEEELLAALELRRSGMRPSTSAQIDSSLRVIDKAIAELEVARRRDPNNPAIRQLLAASRARKLEVLRQAQDAS
jgi:hypothetical protein